MIGPPAPNSKQADAAQDQRAHDPLAEIGFGDQQRAQPVGRNDQRSHGLLRGGVRKRRPPGHLRQFAHELAGAVRDDQRAATRLIALGDVDVAGEDDE